MKNVFERLMDLDTIIQDKIYQNQNIMKLLKYASDTPLLEADIDNPLDLEKKNLYWDIRAFDETQVNSQGVLMTQIVANSISGTNSYVDIYLRFIICISKDITRIEYNDKNVRRMFALGNELYRCFNDIDLQVVDKNEYLGAGKTLWNDFRISTGSTDYETSEIIFKLVDFK